jgi:cathepsin A (carboxypeptidase C)
MMCNYIGNERWVEKLETKFSEEFKSAKSLPWVTIESGLQVGEVRTAGGRGSSAGNVTFVNVFDSG